MNLSRDCVRLLDYIRLLSYVKVDEPSTVWTILKLDKGSLGSVFKLYLIPYFSHVVEYALPYMHFYHCLRTMLHGIRSNFYPDIRH
jgi:hypothetical protein